MKQKKKNLALIYTGNSKILNLCTWNNIIVPFKVNLPFD